jgi:hypothetical protein
MYAVRLVKRVVRFGFRTVLMPALVASLVLGASAGPNGSTAKLSPDPGTIIHELQAHHELPKGTTLSLGDPKQPLTVAYDAKGRLLITPPKGETFGTIASRGFTKLTSIAEQSTSALAKSGTDVAAAPAAPKQ